MAFVFEDEQQAPKSGRFVFEDEQSTPATEMQEAGTVGRSLVGYASPMVETYYGAKQLLKGGLEPDEQANLKAWQQMGEEAPFLSKLAGTVAPMMVGGAGLARTGIKGLATVGQAMSAPQTVAQAAGAGAALMGLQPVEGDGVGLMERTGQAALGAGAGALGQVAPAAIGRIVNPKAAQTVRESVGELTPGQALGGVWKKAEEKASSLPFAGQIVSDAQRRSVESFNKGVLDHVLAPIKQKAMKIGHEGIKEVGEKISGQYEALLPTLKIKADADFLKQVAGVKNLATALPDDKLMQLNRIIDQNVTGKFTEHGLMSGTTMKQVDSEIGRLIRGYQSSANFDERQLGSALREVQSALRSMVERNNPDKAGQLAAINDAFSKFIRVERAASGVGAKDGIFTPAQLNSAIKATDTSLRKGKFAKGEALMQDMAKRAEATIGNKYPDSGTAGRLAQMGALGAYIYNPLLTAGEAGIGAMYGIPAARNSLMALIAKRPDIAPQIANQLRLASPMTGAIGAAMPLALE